MEKGTIKSYDKDCGMGTIRRAADLDIQFYADSIVGKTRAGLKQGDLVWFDLRSLTNLSFAVNIEKCL